MRIAFISYEYPPDSSAGGIATYAAQAARMHADRGHEVEVFASSPNRDGVEEGDGILIHWIRETDRGDFGIVAGHRFATRHRVRPFDVIEGPDYNADARKAVELVPAVPLVLKMHTPSQMIAEINADRRLAFRTRFALKRLKAAGLAWCRSRSMPPLALTQGQARYPVYQREMEHAQRAAIVAPPCEDLCRMARKAWRVSPDRVRYTPHPYVPSPELLALEPRPTGFTVGFVGRLEKRKGIEVLVEAIPRVLRAVPEARFELVGAALTRAESGRPYDEWIRERLGGLMESVSMPGKCPLEKMPSVYGGLDICVFPSLWENFPNVCLEAMAAGRAVIGSAAGGMTEMLDHGKAGVLVPAGNAAKLADALIGLLKNPAERLRLGGVARQRVLGAYNKDVIGKMMEDVYQEAITRHRRSPAERPIAMARPEDFEHFLKRAAAR